MVVACYCRVSTEDQSLERQLQATRDYAGDTFGANLNEIEVYRDKSTGTDTERGAYQEMMNDAENDEFEAVVAKSVSRVARSIRDLERTAERLKDNDTGLYGTPGPASADSL